MPLCCAKCGTWTPSRNAWFDELCRKCEIADEPCVVCGEPKPLDRALAAHCSQTCEDVDAAAAATASFAAALETAGVL